MISRNSGANKATGINLVKIQAALFTLSNWLLMMDYKHNKLSLML